MENEKEVLLSLYKKAKTGKEAIRYIAVLLVKEGHKLKEVAKLFYVDEETVRNYLLSEASFFLNLAQESGELRNENGVYKNG